MQMRQSNREKISGQVIKRNSAFVQKVVVHLPLILQYRDGTGRDTFVNYPLYNSHIINNIMDHLNE
jgi:hypothetical protein